MKQTLDTGPLVHGASVLDSAGFTATSTLLRPEPAPTEAAPVPAVAPAPVAPLPERAAVAILGSMIFLILALTFILVQITWVDPANASESPVAEAELAAGR